MTVVVSISCASKSEVAAMLLNLERAEINAREDLQTRLAAIEQKLLFAAEEREDSFLIVVFEDRNAEAIQLRRITEKVFFCGEKESFFTVIAGPDEAPRFYHFSNLTPLREDPHRETILRDPDFHAAIFGA